MVLKPFKRTQVYRRDLTEETKKLRCSILNDRYSPADCKKILRADVNDFTTKTVKTRQGDLVDRKGNGKFNLVHKSSRYAFCEETLGRKGTYLLWLCWAAWFRYKNRFIVGKRESSKNKSKRSELLLPDIKWLQTIKQVNFWVKKRLVVN